MANHQFGIGFYLAIAAAVLLLIAAVVAILLYVFRRDKEKNSTSQQAPAPYGSPGNSYGNLPPAPMNVPPTGQPEIPYAGDGVTETTPVKNDAGAPAKIGSEQAQEEETIHTEELMTEPDSSFVIVKKVIVTGTNEII